MTNFAENLKKIRQEAIYREENPDIEEWKKEQRWYIEGQKERILRDFETKAYLGWDLIVCWSFCAANFDYDNGQFRNIPGAEETILEMLKEIFTPYGITVKKFSVKQYHAQPIYATFEIK